MNYIVINYSNKELKDLDIININKYDFELFDLHFDKNILFDFTSNNLTELFVIKFLERLSNTDINYVVIDFSYNQIKINNNELITSITNFLDIHINAKINLRRNIYSKNISDFYCEDILPNLVYEIE